MARYRKGYILPSSFDSYVNNPSELFDYTMSNLTETFQSQIMTAQSGEGAFKAVCLSGINSNNNTGNGTHFLDAFVDIIDKSTYIIVKPLAAFGSSLPDPRNFDDIADIENIIGMYGNVFLAKSSYPYDAQSPVNFGQVIICRFEEGSVLNSDFRGLVFDEPTNTIFDQSYRDLMTANRLETAESLYGYSTPTPLGSQPPYPSPEQFNTSDVPPLLADSSTEIEQLAAAYDNTPEVPLRSNNDPKIAIAHPEFQKYIKAFIYKCWFSFGIKINLNSTYRNRAAQNKLIDEYNRGKRRIKPANYSYHLAGLAFDFNPVMPNGNWINSKAPKSTWISSQIPSIGKSLNLRWGGNFSSNYDPIHFDLGNVYDRNKMIALIKKANRSRVESTSLSLGALV